MGHSQTIHCIGHAPYKNNPKQHVLYFAMSMTEIHQQNKKAFLNDNMKIEYWIAQTKTGEKILNLEYNEYLRKTEDLPKCKLIKCPICNGKRYRMKIISEWSNNKVRHDCVVCNGSGITRKNHWLKWQTWQIEAMKKEFNNLSKCIECKEYLNSLITNNRRSNLCQTTD